MITITLIAIYSYRIQNKKSRLCWLLFVGVNTNYVNENNNLEAYIYLQNIVIELTVTTKTVTIINVDQLRFIVPIALIGCRTDALLRYISMIDLNAYTCADFASVYVREEVKLPFIDLGRAVYSFFVNISSQNNCYNSFYVIFTNKQ
uniref:Uncharacterized protein n=1 Tax=Glossina austeni TaxID=7395 RepID=A0A1A9UE91_GLOAU